MQKNKTKDIIIVGFALFAIFFGAAISGRYVR